MSYTKPTNLVIYETTDYGQFKLTHLNRKVTKNRELERVVLETNKLKFHPITVNSDYEVIDGQHRLKVAEQNKVPVYFMIDEEAEYQDIQQLNVANKNWSILDHLVHHAKRGNISYQVIQSIVKEYHVSISTIIDTFCSWTEPNKSISFKKGAVELKYSEEKIRKILDQYEEIYDMFLHISRKKSFSRTMQVSIIKLIMSTCYRHENMLKNVKKKPDNFLQANKFTQISHCLEELIDGVYNWKLNDKNKMAIKI